MTDYYSKKLGNYNRPCPYAKEGCPENFNNYDLLMRHQDYCRYKSNLQSQKNLSSSYGGFQHLGSGPSEQIDTRMSRMSQSFGYSGNRARSSLPYSMSMQPVPKQLLRREVLRSNLVKEFGLENKNRQLNCFLNVILQSLWQFQWVRHHLSEFVKEPKTKIGAKKLLPIIQSIKQFYQDVFSKNSEVQCKVPQFSSIKVRTELFKLNSDEFPLNSKADACEALIYLLELIHGWNVTSNRNIENYKDPEIYESVDAVCDGCFVHQGFHQYQVQQEQCSCGETSEVKVLNNNLFVNYVNAFNVLETLEKVKGATSGNEVVKIEAAQGKFISALRYEKKKKEEHCVNGEISPIGTKHESQTMHCLQSQPEVFVFNLQYSDDPRPDQILRLLVSISQQFKSNALFSETEEKDAASYIFKGMVCYQGAHYLSFFRRMITKVEHLVPNDEPKEKYFQKFQKEIDESEWTIFDDNVIENKGSWRSVVEQCVEFSCFPTILFYEKVTPSDPTIASTLRLEQDEISSLHRLSKSVYQDFDSGFSQEEIMRQFELEKQFKSKTLKAEAKKELQLNMTKLSQLKKKYRKFGIYLYPCNSCDNGLQALHMPKCLDQKCKSNNNYFQNEVDHNIDQEQWRQCQRDIELWYSNELELDQSDLSMSQASLNEQEPSKDESPTRDLTFAKTKNNKKESLLTDKVGDESSGNKARETKQVQIEQVDNQFLETPTGDNFIGLPELEISQKTEKEKPRQIDSRSSQVKEETTTMWECPKCRVTMELTVQNCQKCFRSRNLFEQIDGYDLQDMLVEVKVASSDKPKNSKPQEQKSQKQMGTVTMWHCPICQVNNKMTEEFCSKCRKQLQYFENIMNTPLTEMLIEIEVAEIEQQEVKSYWKCPRCSEIQELTQRCSECSKDIEWFASIYDVGRLIVPGPAPNSSSQSNTALTRNNLGNQASKESSQQQEMPKNWKCCKCNYTNRLPTYSDIVSPICSGCFMDTFEQSTLTNIPQPVTQVSYNRIPQNNSFSSKWECKGCEYENYATLNPDQCYRCERGRNAENKSSARQDNDNSWVCKGCFRLNTVVDWSRDSAATCSQCSRTNVLAREKVKEAQTKQLSKKITKICPNCTVYELSQGQTYCNICVLRMTPKQKPQPQLKRKCEDCEKELDVNDDQFCRLCSYYHKPSCKKCRRPLVDPKKDCTYCPKPKMCRDCKQNQVGLTEEFCKSCLANSRSNMSASVKHQPSKAQGLLDDSQPPRVQSAVPKQCPKCHYKGVAKFSKNMANKWVCPYGCKF